MSDEENLALDVGLNAFVVNLPDGWQQLPLEREALRARMDDARDNVPAEVPEADYRLFLLLMERLARTAAESGAVLVASFAETLTLQDIEGTTADGEPGELRTILASYSLTTLPAEALGAGRIPFEVLRAVAEQEAQGDGERYAPLGSPVEVELAGGAAIRSTAMVRTGPPLLEYPVDLYVDRYLMLIGEGEGLAIQTFTTPTLPLVDDFQPLFAAIADTLEFVHA
jgi:hypothetical protein